MLSPPQIRALTVNMKLDTYQEYKISIHKDHSYSLENEKGKCTFSNPSTIRGVAKLYTVTRNKELLYVGIAKQPMSSRVNGGLKAKGKNGYHGYKWKTIRDELQLRVWFVKENGKFISLSDMEAIEAEVAYACRNQSGQWPSFQNEIHFQQTKEKHRKVANQIYTKLGA